MGIPVLLYDDPIEFSLGSDLSGFHRTQQHLVLSEDYDLIEEEEESPGLYDMLLSNPFARQRHENHPLDESLREVLQLAYHDVLPSIRRDSAASSIPTSISSVHSNNDMFTTGGITPSSGALQWNLVSLSNPNNNNSPFHFPEETVPIRLNSCHSNNYDAHGIRLFQTPTHLVLRYDNDFINIPIEACFGGSSSDTKVLCADFINTLSDTSTEEDLNTNDNNNTEWGQLLLGTRRAVVLLGFTRHGIIVSQREWAFNDQDGDIKEVSLVLGKDLSIVVSNKGCFVLLRRVIKLPINYNVFDTNNDDLYNQDIEEDGRVIKGACLEFPSLSIYNDKKLWNYTNILDSNEDYVPVEVPLWLRSEEKILNVTSIWNSQDMNYALLIETTHRVLETSPNPEISIIRTVVHRNITITSNTPATLAMCICSNNNRFLFICEKYLYDTILCLYVKEQDGWKFSGYSDLRLLGIKDVRNISSHGTDLVSLLVYENGHRNLKLLDFRVTY